MISSRIQVLSVSLFFHPQCQFPPKAGSPRHRRMTVKSYQGYKHSLSCPTGKEGHFQTLSWKWGRTFREASGKRLLTSHWPDLGHMPIPKPVSGKGMQFPWLAYVKWVPGLWLSWNGYQGVNYNCPLHLPQRVAGGMKWDRACKT